MKDEYRENVECRQTTCKVVWWFFCLSFNIKNKSVHIYLNGMAFLKKRHEIPIGLHISIGLYSSNRYS